MAWENLTGCILGEFAAHAGLLHDRELDAWVRLKGEQVERSRQYYCAHRREILRKRKAYYAALKADPVRYAAHLKRSVERARPTQSARARKWWERLKADPQRYAAFKARQRRTNPKAKARWRARLKADPVRYAEYRRKERERTMARTARVRAA